jgi:hypothetical protein
MTIFGVSMHEHAVLMTSTPSSANLEEQLDHEAVWPVVVPSTGSASRLTVTTFVVVVVVGVVVGEVVVAVTVVVFVATGKNKERKSLARAKVENGRIKLQGDCVQMLPAVTVLLGLGSG